jgi:hypothetical protein
MPAREHNTVRFCGMCNLYILYFFMVQSSIISLSYTSILATSKYHTAGDTIDMLNFHKMAAVVQGVVTLLASTSI